MVKTLYTCKYLGGFNVDTKSHAKLALRALNQLSDDVKEVTLEALIVAGIVKPYIRPLNFTYVVRLVAHLRLKVLP